MNETNATDFEEKFLDIFSTLDTHNVNEHILQAGIPEFFDCALIVDTIDGTETSPRMMLACPSGNGLIALTTPQIELKLETLSNYISSTAIRKGTIVGTTHNGVVEFGSEFIATQLLTNGLDQNKKLLFGYYSTKSPSIQRTEIKRAELIGKAASIALKNAQQIESHKAELQRMSDGVASISHDIINPLTSISLNYELVSRALDRTAQDNVFHILQKARKQIACSISYMKRLLGEMSELNHLEQGSVYLDIQPNDPLEILEEALLLIAPLIREKTIKLTLDTHSNYLPTSCDRNRILQVLMNLLSNAIKFTPMQGSILIRIEQNGNDTLFSVQDTGPGISEKEIKHVFEKYWRSKSHHEAGFGLGLAITKSLVDAHHGEIEVSSVLGIGSTFRFRIPTEAQKYTETIRLAAH